MRLKALKVEVAPVGAGREHGRLKALSSNLDLKVSRDAPEGARGYARGESRRGNKELPSLWVRQ